MSTLGKLAAPVIEPLRQLRHKRSYASARNFVLGRFPRDSVGAEIGVWKGEFSSEILRAVKPIKFHLIDPWKYQTAPEFSEAFYGGAIGESQQNMDLIYRSVVERFRKQIADETIEVDRGTSGEIAAQFPDNYFDWIYVDGDHRYEGALKDLELYHAKLKRGGIVAGDDYANAPNQWWGDGVIRAVTESVRRGLYRDLVVKYNQFVLVKA
jgi:hypothetical protein